MRRFSQHSQPEESLRTLARLTFQASSRTFQASSKIFQASSRTFQDFLGPSRAPTWSQGRIYYKPKCDITNVRSRVERRIAPVFGRANGSSIGLRWDGIPKVRAPPRASRGRGGICRWGTCSCPKMQIPIPRNRVRWVVQYKL